LGHIRYEVYGSPAICCLREQVVSRILGHNRWPTVLGVLDPPPQQVQSVGLVVRLGASGARNVDTIFLMETRKGRIPIFRWRRKITRLRKRVDVHGPTTTVQGRCALATDTPTPVVDAILWSTTTQPRGTCPVSNRRTSKNK
jgi:hypothetical protein